MKISRASNVSIKIKGIEISTRTKRNCIKFKMIIEKSILNIFLVFLFTSKVTRTDESFFLICRIFFSTCLENGSKV